MGFYFRDLLNSHMVYPQVSILGPLLFHINLCDLFLSEYSSEFTNYAEDTTSYENGKYYDEQKQSPVDVL